MTSKWCCFGSKSNPPPIAAGKHGDREMYPSLESGPAGVQQDAGAPSCALRYGIILSTISWYTLLPQAQKFAKNVPAGQKEYGGYAFTLYACFLEFIVALVLIGVFLSKADFKKVIDGRRLLGVIPTAIAAAGSYNFDVLAVLTAGPVRKQILENLKIPITALLLMAIMRKVPAARVSWLNIVAITASAMTCGLLFTNDKIAMFHEKYDAQVSEFTDQSELVSSWENIDGQRKDVKQQDEAADEMGVMILGVIYCLAKAVCSCMSTILFERVLKTAPKGEPAYIAIAQFKLVATIPCGALGFFLHLWTKNWDINKCSLPWDGINALFFVALICQACKNYSVNFLLKIHDSFVKVLCEVVVMIITYVIAWFVVESHALFDWELRNADLFNLNTFGSFVILGLLVVIYSYTEALGKQYSRLLEKVGK